MVMIVYYYYAIALAVFMSVIPVTIVVLIRNSVLRQRQTVVRDLASSFNFVDETDKIRNRRSTQDNLIPSFEFVKFKYLLRTNEQGDLVRRDSDY